MSKATLEFDLNEESTEHALAVAGSQIAAGVWDYDQWLRAQNKYAVEPAITSVETCIDRCRERLREVMSERGVAWELIES